VIPAALDIMHVSMPEIQIPRKEELGLGLEVAMVNMHVIVSMVLLVMVLAIPQMTMVHARQPRVLLLVIIHVMQMLCAGIVKLDQLFLMGHVMICGMLMRWDKYTYGML